jgi:glutaredoxin
VTAKAAGGATVEVYGHADCGLCRAAIAVLERLRPELGFALVERDVTADASLHRAYFERVPVIVVDGEELCDYVVDEAVLRRHLAGRRPAAAAGRAEGAGAAASRRRSVRAGREDDLESGR